MTCLIIVVLTATICEIYLHTLMKTDRQVAEAIRLESPNTIQKLRTMPGKMTKCLLCFSLVSNSKKILNISNNEVSYLQEALGISKTLEYLGIYFTMN